MVPSFPFSKDPFVFYVQHRLDSQNNACVVPICSNQSSDLNCVLGGRVTPNAHFLGDRSDSFPFSQTIHLPGRLCAAKKNYPKQ